MKIILVLCALIVFTLAAEAEISDIEENNNSVEQPKDEIEHQDSEVVQESTKRNFTEPRWDRKVMELDADNFDHFVGRFEALMVEFYASWCSHCQEFDPVYQDAAQMLYDGNPRYFLAKIDGSKYPEIRERFEVPGFPTLIFFKKGVPQPFDQDRTARSVAKFVRREGPDKVPQVNCDQLSDLKKRASHLMIYFGYRRTESKYLSILALTGEERRFSFYLNNEPDCAAKHGASMKSIVFVTNFEGEGTRVFQWNGTADAGFVRAWYEPYMIPPLSEFEEDIGLSMRRSKLPTVVLFRPEDDEFEDYAFIYKQAALANRGKAIFVWSERDGEGRELAAHMRVIGPYRDETAPTFPSIRVLWIYRQSRYLSYIKPEDHTVDSITEFVDKCLNGTAKLFLPSENIPKEEQQGKLRQIVGHTFENETNSDTNDLILYWYAPGCPHCEAFWPKFRELAARFEPYTNLRFSHLNAKANGIDGADVDRWPILRFYPRGGSGKASGLRVAEDKRDPDVVAQWLIDNSLVLKEAGLNNLEQLQVKENQNQEQQITQDETIVQDEL